MPVGVGIGTGSGWGSASGSAWRRGRAAGRPGRCPEPSSAAAVAASCGRVTSGSAGGLAAARRSPGGRAHELADPLVLARRRAVVVARVARDRDDPRVAGAPRVRLGELLRERLRPAPPLGRAPAHDPPEGAAVAVVHHREVEHVPELVQQHAARVAQAGPHEDRARPLRVDAARGGRARRAALHPHADAAVHGRHQRPVGVALPRPAQRLAARGHELHRALRRLRARRRRLLRRRARPSPTTGTSPAITAISRRQRFTIRSDTPRSAAMRRLECPGKRAVSSAGQSACLTSRRSPVRARDRPSQKRPRVPPPERPPYSCRGARLRR